MTFRYRQPQITTSKTETIIIYINRIAVNQLDSQEKSELVTKTDWTYQAASEIFVWLGQEHLFF